MEIHAHIHCQRIGVFGQPAMRVTIQMPASAGGLVPGAHGIVAQDDSLLADSHLCQVTQPNEPVLQFAHSSVVVALDEKDSRATNAIEVPLGVLCSSEAEIAKEVEDVPLLGCRVEPIEDGGIHFTYITKGTAAVSNNVSMAEVEISSEPNIAHGKPNDSSTPRPASTYLPHWTSSHLMQLVSRFLAHVRWQYCAPRLTLGLRRLGLRAKEWGSVRG